MLIYLGFILRSGLVANQLLCLNLTVQEGNAPFSFRFLFVLRILTRLRCLRFWCNLFGLGNWYCFSDLFNLFRLFKSFLRIDWSIGHILSLHPLHRRSIFVKVRVNHKTKLFPSLACVRFDGVKLGYFLDRVICFLEREIRPDETVLIHMFARASAHNPISLGG